MNDKKYIGALPVGFVLKGDAYSYKIERVLGQGSFGITYLATVNMEGALGSLPGKMQVCVKEFFMQDINGREGSTVTSGSKGGIVDDYKRKFRREASNLASLNHPNIAKVLESFDANGTAYYVMEYIDGLSLDDMISKKGNLTAEETCKIMLQVCSAVSFMHQHKMLHLDIKPKNIMMRRNGDAVLIDFGLSKQYNEKGEPESSTKVGGGTPGYSPIEQASYHEGNGFPVTMDVYALGGTMYKMLTGHRPPDASEILNDGFPWGEMKQHNVPDKLIKLVAHAMAPTKKQRISSVEEISRQLNSLKDTNNNKVDDSKKNKDHEFTEFDINKADNQKQEQESDLKSSANNKRRYIIIGVIAAIIVAVSLYFVQDSKTVQTEKDRAASETYDMNVINSIDMVFVKGGTFIMGQSDGTGWDPKHKVTLSDFYIGKTEVTQAQWKAVMGNNPSKIKGDSLPVENVTWADVHAFIDKLNKITGKNYRLPTEAEWEFAARGGNESKGYTYSGSNSLDKVGWYDQNSSSSTHPVGTKAPNELGIYDMSGNVNEWCSDSYLSYPTKAQVNPKGGIKDHDENRHIIRGGGWDGMKYGCVTTERTDGGDYTKHHGSLGFRLALDSNKK